MGEKTILLTRDGVPKDPYRRRHGSAEERRMTPTLPPFVRPGSLHSPTFCWMLCDPSVFYRIWFWPSADAENTKPDHDEKIFFFFHNSLWITFPTQSCLVFYSFFSSLPHSLTKWLIISSFSPHNLHLLFCCMIDFRFNIIGPYGLVFFLLPIKYIQFL